MDNCLNRYLSDDNSILQRTLRMLSLTSQKLFAQLLKRNNHENKLTPPPRIHVTPLGNVGGGGRGTRLPRGGGYIFRMLNSWECIIGTQVHILSAYRKGRGAVKGVLPPQALEGGKSENFTPRPALGLT